MKKIAVFAEGQSEQIFVRHLLTTLLGLDKISFECFRLCGGRMDFVPYQHRNDDAEVHILIVNVGNDEKVLSAVKEREKKLIEKGFEKIIALRDMYSQEYKKRACGVIDDNVTRIFIERANVTIRNMTDPAKIKMHFAIMELEAWFLGMYNVFERLDPTLKVDYIERQLGFNLSRINPQTEFFKPADIVNKVLQLVGLQYQKTKDDVESICSKIGGTDFLNVFENGRCSSFKAFYDEVLN